MSPEMKYIVCFESLKLIQFRNFVNNLLERGCHENVDQSVDALRFDSFRIDE